MSDLFQGVLHGDGAARARTDPHGRAAVRLRVLSQEVPTTGRPQLTHHVDTHLRAVSSAEL